MTRELKADIYWISVVGAFVLALFLAGFAVSRYQTEQPPVQWHGLILRHESAQAPCLISEADLQQQAIYPVPPGRRRPIEEQLSPEMRHKVAVWEILNGGRDPFVGRWK